MLNSSQSRKRHEQGGKEDLAGAWETRTIGSGLRGHNDDQIRLLKPNDRPETTKEYAGWETEEEDTLTENKGDWGSRCWSCKQTVDICLLAYISARAYC